MAPTLEFAQYLYTQGTGDYISLSSKGNIEKEDLLKKKKFIKRIYTKYVNEIIKHILEKEIANDLIDAIGPTKLTQFKVAYENNSTSTSIIPFGVSVKKRIRKIIGVDIDSFILDKIWVDVATNLASIVENRA